MIFAPMVFNKRGAAMKTLLLIGVLAGSMLLTTGCGLGGDPAYSLEERSQLITRNGNYEGGQLIDDFDHLLLLRPASRLTEWNVQ
jgi:hypothetical protein